MTEYLEGLLDIEDAIRNNIEGNRQRSRCRQLLNLPGFTHVPLEDQLGYYGMITWKDEYGSCAAFLGKNEVAEVFGDADDDEETATVYMRSCFRGADKHYDSWSFQGVPAAKKWVEEYVAAWVRESGLMPSRTFEPYPVATRREGLVGMVGTAAIQSAGHESGIYVHDQDVLLPRA